MTVAPPTVGAGVAVPGFTIVELVSESGPWVIYDSVAQDGARVRIKTARAQYPRVRDLAELRREYDILTRLALPGVIAARALVPHGAGNLALVTESFGDSLAHILAARSGSPLPIDAFFTPTSLGLAWLQGSKPQAADFVRLKAIPFRHALCGHGSPARDSMAGYHAAFNRFFQV